MGTAVVSVTHGDLAIVIPCFNEERRLDVDRFRLYLADSRGADLIFVDDGSTDGTREVIERIRQGYETRVAVLRQSPNAGKGEAVRLGLLDGVQRRFRYVGFLDADLATPLEAIPDFRVLLDEHPKLTMVLGARVRLLGREIQRRAARHYLGRVFATAVSAMLSLPVYDTQCGAKLFRVTPELQDLLHEPFISRWIFDVELLARLIRSRRRNGGPPAEQCVYELPLVRWTDVRGSKLRYSDFVIAMLDLVRIYLRYMRGRRSRREPVR
jgi:dolichyl-phosphate beta-glucosyltransferase